MNTYQLLSIALIFLFGISSSLNEKNEQKISNKLILIGAVLGVTLKLLFILWDWEYGKQLILSYDNLVYFINLFIVAIGGFMLWKSNFIDAKIVKLIFLYATLIPISFIKIGYLSFFPSLVFFVNTILLIGVCFVVEFLIFWLRVLLDKGYRNSIKWGANKGSTQKQLKTKSFSEYAWIFLGFVALLELIRSARLFLLNNFRSTSSDLLFLAIIGLYFFRRKMRRMTQQKVLLVVTIISACFLWWRSLYKTGNISWIPMVQALIVVGLIKLFRQKIMKKTWNIFERNVWRKRISLDEFAWPMVPARHFYESIMKNCDNSEAAIMKKIIINEITPEQVLWMKKQAKKNNIENLSVQKSFHPAIWMFLGAILTIWARCPVIDFVFNFFHR